MVGHRRKPVEIGEQVLGALHDRLDALGDPIGLFVVGGLRERARHFLDDLIAGVGDGVHRMPEADDDLLGRHAPPDVGVRLVRRGIPLLNLERHLVRPAVLGAAQRADGPRHAGIDVRAGARNHARREGRCVEFMLRI
jgi:hypothetical protein